MAISYILKALRISRMLTYMPPIIQKTMSSKVQNNRFYPKTTGLDWVISSLADLDEVEVRGELGGLRDLGRHGVDELGHPARDRVVSLYYHCHYHYLKKKF